MGEDSAFFFRSCVKHCEESIFPSSFAFLLFFFQQKEISFYLFPHVPRALPSYHYYLSIFVTVTSSRAFIHSFFDSHHSYCPVICLLLLFLHPALTPTFRLFCYYRAVPNVSSGLRAEFARGDGRVKRKEDERKKVIAPSETLFVVNFNEAKTKRENLAMLFEPFGEILRIDMKKNYAFVQFRTIEQATRAKTETDGGKLDQSVITVEYVARQRADEGRRSDRSASGDRRPRGRMDDRRGPPPPHMMRGGPPPPDRYDRRYDYDRFDDRYRRGPPPPPPPRRGSRSRSRSPGRHYGGYRERSPPRGGRYPYDDYRGGGGGGDRPRSRSPGGYPPNDRYRPRSPDGAYDRGYRS